MTRITEFAWNSHFLDEQLRGPFATFHHRHGIQAEYRDGIEGTLVTDEIEYALPYGFIGRLGGRFSPSEAGASLHAPAEAIAGDSVGSGPAGGAAGVSALGFCAGFEFMLFHF